MRFDVFLYTNEGGRSHNEDAARWSVRDGNALFLVADGLGGHRGGEIASSLAADCVLSDWETAEVPENRAAWLADSILRANDALLREQEERAASMKSTIPVLAADGDRASWAHVGDSRVYLLTGGRILRLTQDHSVTYKKYLAGEITRNGVNFDEDRSSLLRAVGERERCLPESGPACGRRLAPGDALLLCTDGFWEYLYDEEMLADFLKASTAREWAERMLVRALPRFSPHHDNLTLLAVFAGGEEGEFA